MSSSKFDGEERSRRRTYQRRVFPTVQVSNLFALAEQKFPALIAKPIGAQFVRDDLIALFEFERGLDDLDLSVAAEKHYRLVPAEQIPDSLIQRYALRPED